MKKKLFIIVPVVFLSILIIICIYFLNKYRILIIKNNSTFDLENISIKYNNKSNKTIYIYNLKKNEEESLILKKGSYLITINNFHINNFYKDKFSLNSNKTYIIKPIYCIKTFNKTDKEIKNITFEDKYYNIIKQINNLKPGEEKDIYFVEDKYYLKIDNSDEKDLIINNSSSINIARTNQLIITNKSNKPLYDIIIENKNNNSTLNINYLDINDSQKIILNSGIYNLYYKNKPNNKINFVIDNSDKVKTFYKLTLVDTDKDDIIIPEYKNSNYLSKKIINNLQYRLDLLDGIYNLSLKRSNFYNELIIKNFIKNLYINNKLIKNDQVSTFYDNEDLNFTIDTEPDLKIDENDLSKYLKLQINHKDTDIKWDKIEMYTFQSGKKISKLNKGNYLLTFFYKKNISSYNIKVMDDDSDKPHLEIKNGFYTFNNRNIPFEIEILDTSGINIDKSETYIESIYCDDKNCTNFYIDDIKNIQRIPVNNGKKKGVLLKGVLNTGELYNKIKFNILAKDNDNDHPEDSYSDKLEYQIIPYLEGYLNHSVKLVFNLTRISNKYKIFLNNYKTNIKDKIILVTAYYDKNQNLSKIDNIKINSVITNELLNKLEIEFEFIEKNKYRIEDKLIGEIKIKDLTGYEQFDIAFNPVLLKFINQNDIIKAKTIYLK